MALPRCIRYGSNLKGERVMFENINNARGCAKTALLCGKGGHAVEGSAEFIIWVTKIRRTDDYGRKILYQPWHILDFRLFQVIIRKRPNRLLGMCVIQNKKCPGIFTYFSRSYHCLFDTLLLCWMAIAATRCVWFHLFV